MTGRFAVFSRWVAEPCCIELASLAECRTSVPGSSGRAGERKYAEVFPSLARDADGVTIWSFLCDAFVLDRLVGLSAVEAVKGDLRSSLEVLGDLGKR